MNNIWSQLALFESTDLIKRLFLEKHCRELNSGKAKEIVSNLVQGREYFASAENASEIVKPLLQYYGVVSLSRGLILFLSTNARESSLKPSHGLSLENGHSILSQGLENLPNIPIKVTNGAFIELYEATKNEEKSVIYIAPYPNRILLSSTLGTNPEGASFPVKEILSRNTSLYDIYKRVFNENPKCYKCLVFLLSLDTHIEILIYKNENGFPDEEELQNLLDLKKEYYLRSSDNHHFLGNVNHMHYRIAKSGSEDLINLLPPVKNSFNNDTFLITPIQGNIVLSTLLEFYSISYFMSMIVRYYPSHWMSFITRNNGDLSYPLFKYMINEIQDKFPILIIRELEKPKT